MSTPLVRVEKVSKKFCRRLRRSLWYGLIDMTGEFLGRNDDHARLRAEEFWALSEVSFDLQRGETIGLIGPNGAGKTTLLRILNGLIKPDIGRVEVRGRMQALIALGAGFNPILTGRENIYVNASVLGIPQSEVKRRFDEIVEFSGVEEFLDTPVQHFSSGMAVRLGFSVSAFLYPDILLVDEVLAVGDEGFQMKCLNKIGELKKQGTGIILVSHNMHTISTFSSEVLLLQRGRHQIFENVSEGVREYRKYFVESNQTEIQKICSGNSKIGFQVALEKGGEYRPGDSFMLELEYDSEIDYEDAEIDVAVYSSREPFLHHQATNRAYHKPIHLKRGKHRLGIVVEDVRIHDALARFSIAIWSKGRSEKLFWWRFPAHFGGVDHATGNSFLNVRFRDNPEADESEMREGESGNFRSEGSIS